MVCLFNPEMIKFSAILLSVKILDCMAGSKSANLDMVAESIGRFFEIHIDLLFQAMDM